MQKGIEKEVPQEVKSSVFGCRNCLWSSIECKRGSMYNTEGKKVDCQGYTYYD